MGKMSEPSSLMRGMQLNAPGQALQEVVRPIPDPKADELLLSVTACGVCRTDLHIRDGEVPANLPVIPGHEIVGRVLKAGADVSEFQVGDRVGVPWLGRVCGHCFYCNGGHENLCDTPTFTGCTRDGGFATHCIAAADFCFGIPDKFGDVEAAPLLCAGLIGFRSYRMAGDVSRLGLYGFGAAAHILAQIAVGEGKQVYAFTRDGDQAAQSLALSLGCSWAGAAEAVPPEPLDAAILFAPAGALVPQALRTVRKGGRVICAGIHMSDIPSFPYSILWEERSIQSVANLTRSDGAEFFRVAARLPVRTTTERFALNQAEVALTRLREGKISGAAVLVP
jgi:propanol-preferring alcohol dehydrogenase